MKKPKNTHCVTCGGPAMAVLAGPDAVKYQCIGVNMCGTFIVMDRRPAKKKGARS